MYNLRPLNSHTH